MYDSKNEKYNSKHANILISDGEKLDRFIKSVMFGRGGFLGTKENISHLAKSISAFISKECDIFTRAFLSYDCHIHCYSTKYASGVIFHYRQADEKFDIQDYENLGAFIRHQGCLIENKEK